MTLCLFTDVPSVLLEEWNNAPRELSIPYFGGRLKFRRLESDDRETPDLAFYEEV